MTTKAAVTHLRLTHHDADAEMLESVTPENAQIVLGEPTAAYNDVRTWIKPLSGSGLRELAVRIEGSTVTARIR